MRQLYGLAGIVLFVILALVYYRLWFLQDSSLAFYSILIFMGALAGLCRFLYKLRSLWMYKNIWNQVYRAFLLVAYCLVYLAYKGIVPTGAAEAWTEKQFGVALSFFILSFYSMYLVLRAKIILKQQ